MAAPVTYQAILEEVKQMTPHLLNLPAGKVWVDYDREADVLYISFQKPQRATDSELLDDGVLLRYRGKQLVGVTIFEASQINQNKHENLSVTRNSPRVI